MSWKSFLRTLAVLVGICLSLGLGGCGGVGVNSVTGPNPVYVAPTATPLLAAAATPVDSPTPDRSGVAATPTAEPTPTSSVPDGCPPGRPIWACS